MSDTCVACCAFAAECITPVGDGAAELCWLCAHQVTEHAKALEAAASARCSCKPEGIYPPRYMAKRRQRLEALTGEPLGHAAQPAAPRREAPQRPQAERDRVDRVVAVRHQHALGRREACRDPSSSG